MKPTFLVACIASLFVFTAMALAIPSSGNGIGFAQAAVADPSQFVVPIAVGFFTFLGTYVTMRAQVSQAKMKVDLELRKLEIAEQEKQEAKRQAEEARALADAREEKRKAAVEGEKIAVAEASKAVLEKERAVREKEQLFDEFTLPKQPPIGSRRCTMLVLAIGGTGKTTLFQRVFGWLDANPKELTTAVATRHHDLHRARQASGNGGHLVEDRVRVWVTDYVGQNLGSLVRYFIEEQKKVRSPNAYGHINALCLMVDVKHPVDYEYDTKFGGEEELVEEARSKQPNAVRRKLVTARKDLFPGKVDPTRVKQHIDKWNDQSLNAVFGLLTTGATEKQDAGLREVCFFINKVDTITQRPDGWEADLEMEFAPLIDRLRKRVPGGRVTVIHGSAEHATGTGRLREAIFDAADPEPEVG